MLRVKAWARSGPQSTDVPADSAASVPAKKGGAEGMQHLAFPVITLRLCSSFVYLALVRPL